MPLKQNTIIYASIIDRAFEVAIEVVGVCTILVSSWVRLTIVVRMSSSWDHDSERAPGPIFRHATCHRLRWPCTHLLRMQTPVTQSLVVWPGQRCGRFTFVCVAILAVLTPHAPSLVPLLILSVATIARAGLYPFWVELCTLIQRYCIGSVLGTEDVATVTAVMLPYE